MDSAPNDRSRPADDPLARGILIAYFQPIVDVHTHELVSAEALARLLQADGSALPAGAFLPGRPAHELARIDAEVRRDACQRTAHWARRYGRAAFPVSINLEAGELADPETPARLFALCEDAELDPTWITLEITEHAEVPKDAAATVHALRDLGFGIAIDDFGTGHATFGTVLELCADILKLDRKFVMHAVNDRVARTMIGATVEVAHSAGMQVVAEGVETAVELELVRDLGCDLVQGYHFAPALGAVEFHARFIVPLYESAIEP